ncbi:MAG TPA: GNAT family N-acetyltransferase [Desulfosporosinus sp.]|nr:GNAT family N-acetyltransferase [Desulfosporosinus sp.]
MKYVMTNIKELDQGVGNIHNHEYIIERGTIKDIDELEDLYNDLNDHLKLGTNYAGWAKGIYPIRETAVRGIQNDTLFVLKIDSTIAGSMILNHEPETAYAQATWGIEADYNDVFVIHTLVVSPKYMNHGIGKKLMQFARTYSLEQGMKTIRLDVSIHNTPAISLYEKCGYEYLGTIDLGLNIPDLVWFKLYEIVF